MGSAEPPLLRVHWPDRLLVADPHAAALQLVGCRAGSGVSELVVTGTASSGGTATAGAAVGTLLLRQGQAATAPGSTQPTFVLRPTNEPGGQLPILLQPGSPATQDAAPGHRRRSARLQQQQQQQKQQQQPAGHPSQQDWQCQFILHHSTQGLVRSRACSRPGSTPGSRQQVASQLAVHMIGALLALLLLAQRQAVIAALSLGGSTLATFATRQLLWLMTAQPGGVKLHRQLCELLSVAGLQYVASVRWLLSGRAVLLGKGATGVLGAVLAAGGPLHGLVALRCLLWALALPVSLAYAATAAAYRWQLRSTAVMWRVMRGRQRMPLIRQRAIAAARRWLRHSGSGVSGGGGQADEPHSPRSTFRLYSAGGSGLKQLSGSMLLFMPLLLLLPTTASFYALALALHTACALPRAAVLLVEQLLRHNPAAAALGQLLQPGGSGSGSSARLQYSLVQVEWAPSALSAAEQHAAERAVYLRAQVQHGSPLHAAAQAAAAAWAACDFQPAGRMLLQVLQGQPLHLAPPLLPA